MPEYNPGKTNLLCVARRKVKLSQTDAGAYLGLEGNRCRYSVGAWEAGTSAPHLELRDRFIAYLWDKLKLQHAPERMESIWHEVMVDQWGWEPLGEHEHLARTQDHLIKERVTFVREANSVPNNLPAAVTGFIGRAKEITAVCSLLRRTDVRLVTLTGPGGTGKTRLALEVAKTVLDSFADGVYLVALALIRDPALVPSTIMQTLGLVETGERTVIEGLVMHLRDKHVLLVLDNFEQVGTAASVITDLLQTAPRLKVLVTSRETLRLYGEHHFQVPPLALPNPQQLPSLDDFTQYEAVRLFFERAQAAKSTFRMTNENVRAVAEICVRLDGLPLAIELAAARSTLFAPQALLSRLDHPFRLLTSDLRGRHSERQQTLRNTIDWSYALLTSVEQVLFVPLAVFIGGCTIESAESVCNVDDDLGIDMLEGLDSLVRKSLLRQEEENNSEPRFLMLETIREYAQEQLTAQGGIEVLRQHANYYLGFVEAAERELKGAQQGVWLDKLECEHDNVRVALQWFIQQGEIQKALRLSGAVWLFWWLRGFISEGRQQLEHILSLDTNKTIARTKALNGAGYLASFQLARVRARSLYEESLGISWQLGDFHRIGEALHGLGNVALSQADDKEAIRLYTDSLAYFEKVGDKWGCAWSRHSLGKACYRQGDSSRAIMHLEHGLALNRELGNKRGIASSLNNLGDIARHQNDGPSAMRFYEESLRHYRELQHKQGIAAVLHNIGYIVKSQSDLARAAASFKEGLILFHELGNIWCTADCITGLAGMALAIGQAERAARLMSAAEALHEMVDPTGAAMEPANRVEWEQNVAGTKSLLDNELFEAVWTYGKEMPLEAVIADALSINIS
jgi:predicted ATPase